MDQPLPFAAYPDHEAPLAFDTPVPEYVYRALWLDPTRTPSSAEPRSVDSRPSESLSESAASHPGATPEGIPTELKGLRFRPGSSAKPGVITAPLDGAWSYGWRIGPAAYSRVLDPEAATWSAKTRVRLKVPQVGIVRPVYCTDGRFIASGWRADSFVPGVRTRRVDELVHAAIKLDRALSNYEIPEHALAQPGSAASAFDVADRMAQQETLAAEDDVALHRLWRPLAMPPQLCHADMYGTTIFAGSNPPTVTDLVATARPFGYTAALAIVDALLAGTTDVRIIDRFAPLVDQLDSLVVAALRYRLLVRRLLEKENPQGIWDFPGWDREFVRVRDALVTRSSDTL